nr:copia protein [Tanacetum cinerariifolium]
KKQTVVATSSTEAEYVVAASGCAQVLWMQNQLLDYGILGFELTMQVQNRVFKKDERGIVVRNKAQLVAQGHTQEEEIDYEEVFAPVARIEAISLFLAYAFFMGFMVYQMDGKSAFLYGTIEEERVEIVINSPWMLSKNWLVQKQTAFSKDTSNPFMANNLPKIVWFSTHHITCMKSWLVQKQTALGQTTTGKESSNPFMAGSLPKTISYSFLHGIFFHMSPFEFTFVYLVVTSIDLPLLGANTPRSDEDIFKLMELMVFLMKNGVCDEFGLNAARLLRFLLSGKSVEKHSGDVTRLQALVDKKRIVITEEVVREILQLNDAEGVICLPNEDIFAEVQVPAQGDDVYEHAAEEVATDVVPPTPTSPSPSSPVIPTSPLHQSPCPPQPQDADGLSHLFQQVLDTCSALTHRVKVLENDKVAQQLEIVKLKAKVKKLEKLNKVKSSKLRWLKKVGTSQRVESSDDVENVFNQGRISVDMDQDEGIELKGLKDKGKRILIEAPKPIKKKDQVEMDAEYANKLQEELDKE